MSGKLPTKTLKPHTNAHAVRDRPTLKDVYQRTFRSGSFQGLSSISNKLKRVLTSSHQIVDDHSKNITNDNTNDSDKTNYTEVNSSQDMESSKVSSEEIKVELRQDVSLNTSAILENNNLRYYVSPEDTKITNFFMLFTCFLLIVSSLSLLNEDVFVIMLNKKAILFSILVASLISCSCRSYM
jgi:hypothetical protein